MREVSNQASKQCSQVSHVALQLDKLEHDLRKNIGYHNQLDRIVDLFGDPRKTISVPFQFFYDLHREQEREVVKLAEKVRHAEALAQKFAHETLKKQSLAESGNLVDGDLDQVSLRDKIYQVCSMLYEMQNRAGYNLALLESKVTAVRKDFTMAMLTSSRRAWETEDSID